MSNLRLYLVQVIAFLLIAAVVYRSWGPGIGALKKDAAAVPAAPSLDEQVFTLQAKILIGSVLWAEDNKAELPQGTTQDIETKILEGYRQTIQDSLSGDESKNPRIPLFQKRLIVAAHLGLEEETQKLWGFLTAQPFSSAETDRITQTIGKAYHLTGPAEVPQSDDLNFVEQKFPWFGALVRYAAEPEQTKKEQAKNSFAPQARSAIAKLGSGLVIFSMLAFSSLILFGIFLRRASTGRLVFEYQPPVIHPQYLLEVFTLYLALMLGGSFVIGQYVNAGGSVSPLLANMLLIGSLPLLILWPVVNGCTWANARQSIGLQLINARTTLRNLLMAPMVYVGSWSMIFSILFCYSLFIYWLKIDLTRGAHPIVPMLLSADAKQTSILLLLAVGVAPIVEEIFFRGALYGWLRSWSGRGFAMVISALIFAIVHPQGAIGVVPLASIGLVLAFAREWKQSLVLCMAIHACFNAGTMALLLLFFR